MQKSGRMQTDVDDAVFSKPHRNWTTRTRLRPGTGTRTYKARPSESLPIAEIADRIRFGRY